MILHIITRHSKPDYINLLSQNLTAQFANRLDVQVKWHILVDASKIAAFQLEEQPPFPVHIEQVDKDPQDMYLHKAMSQYCNAAIHSGWILFIDDDNILHDNYLDAVSPYLAEEIIPETRVIVTHQDVDYKDFAKVKIRVGAGENMKVQHVDLAQVTFHHTLFKTGQIPEEYVGDGLFIQSLYSTDPKMFLFVDAIGAYYNYYQQTNITFIPTVLSIGDDLKLMATENIFQFSERYMNVIYRKTDEDLISLQSKYNIDLYVTTPEVRDKLTVLPYQRAYIRRKWIELDKDQPHRANIIYNTVIQTAVDNYDTQDLISVFTSTYNTGKDVLRLYHSLKQQTYTNWEWTVVDDSTDNSLTYDLLTTISKSDSRVKVYTFNEKTGGNIGEAKYRAAMLCKGSLLLEVDHDDMLLPDACQKLVKASEMYPTAGFFYSNCVELNADYTSRTYGPDWGFGYGSYKTEVIELFGKRQVTGPVTPDINPKTVRHIVSMPNHFRAWRRETYLQIGGHNRNLSIVDDYELMVRTFLNTRMVCIPDILYVQMYDGNNSQDKCRPEISRRVDSIRHIYNERIKNRFAELGIEDWCDTETRFLQEPSRFGEGEGKANFTFIPVSE